MNKFQYILTNLNTSASKTLDASPAGFKDSSTRYYRNKRYHSVLREDGLSQRFANVGGELNDKGGYFFVLNAYLTDGEKARVKYERKILNPFTELYEDDYLGMLDYRVDSGWINEPYKWFEIKTIDSDKLAKFISRDEINYNVFSLISHDNITVPGFSFPYKNALYKSVNIYLGAETYGSFKIGTLRYGGTPTVNELGEALLIEVSPSDSKIYTNNKEAQDTLVNFVLNGVYSVTCTADDPSSLGWDITYEARFRAYSSAGVLQSTDTYTLIELSGSGTTYYKVFTGVYDIDLSALELIVDVDGWVEFDLGLTESARVTVTGNTIQARSFDFYEKTDGRGSADVRGLMAHEALFRLIQLSTSETNTSNVLEAPILGNTSTEYSSYTSIGELGLEHITNGFLLRQMNESALNLSFADTFKSLSATLPIGLSYDRINDIFRIGHLREFYKDESFSNHLGYVTELKVTPATELYINELITGYPKTDYEEYSGANEVNTETEHRMPSETKTKYNIRSAYRQETIGIELMRRKTKQFYSSEDTKLDAENFITTLDSSFETEQGNITNGSGIVNIDEYYNMQKTPRQNLGRWGELLEASMFLDSAAVTQFTKSVKNKNISYTDPATGLNVNEFDELDQTHVSDKLLLPEKYEFEALFTKSIRDELKDDPHRYYAFYDTQGNELYGYVESIEGNPVTEKGVFTLIRANINR